MPNPFERGPERDPHERVPCRECGGSGKVQKGGRQRPAPGATGKDGT